MRYQTSLDDTSAGACERCVLAVVDANRFWSLVDQSGACWRWLGNVDASGYGRVTVDGRYEYAHRIGWQLVNGSIPAGMQVVAKPMCAYFDCVRPDHHELAHHSPRSCNAIDDLYRLIDDTAGPDGCWWWRGYLSPYGQPVFHVSGERITVHRFLYAATNGIALNKGEPVRHRCGEQSCVNPAHLYRPADDAHLDLVRRPKVNGRKLSVDERIAINNERERGSSVIELARKYGVSHVTIYNVLTRS